MSTKHYLTIEVPADLYFFITKLENQREFVENALRAYRARIQPEKVGKA